jgi:hypothetical protein
VAGRREAREAVEPEASLFAGVVAELVGLDDLVGLTDAAGDDADGVFEVQSRRVTLEVVGRTVVGREEVAGPRIVAHAPKRLADCATGLAENKDLHEV